MSSSGSGRATARSYRVAAPGGEHRRRARALPSAAWAGPLLVLACGPGASDAPEASATSDAPLAPEVQARLTTADSLVASWVESERIPGAVLLVSLNGRVVLERAHGAAKLYDLGTDGLERLNPPRAMTTGTAFDLASLTKVMATTMAVMLLVDRGGLDIDAPVHTYLPDFRGGGKDAITLHHLLTHRAGLSQWQPTYYHASDRDAAYAYVRDLPLAWPVGAERHYSDLGFMVLGRVVEQSTGTPLDRFVREEIYAPLGLTRTGFRPSMAAARSEPSAPSGPSEVAGRDSLAVAATSHGNPFERRMVHDPDFGYRIEGDPDAWNGWRNRTLEGEVNDGNAYHAFQGVAGHAGLFSTASELDVLLRLLLDRGTAESRRLVAPEVVDLFLAPTGNDQALGWQLPSHAPPGSFAHSGFTGTFVLGVPDLRLGLVLLTNRQNLGVDVDGSYPDVAPLQRAVTDALTGDPSCC